VHRSREPLEQLRSRDFLPPPLIEKWLLRRGQHAPAKSDLLTALAKLLKHAPRLLVTGRRPLCQAKINYVGLAESGNPRVVR
jgi:hypothetical protein